MVLSLFISAPSTGGILLPPWDKVGHFAFFGAVASLLAIGFGPSRWLLAFVVACLVGVADEAYQLMLPSRHAGLDDLAMDVVAAAIAVFVVCRLSCRHRTRI